MTDKKSMQASKLHLALVFTAVAMSSLVLWFRLTWAPDGPVSDPAGAGPEAFCVGVDHPDAATGMVCAPSADQVLPRAVERLRLPAPCARVALPAPLRHGDRIAFQNKDDRCQLRSITPLQGGHRLLAGVGIDLSSAAIEDLVLLPGIGEKRARAIADHRASHGPFSSPEDLEEISGIGPKTVERIRPFWEGTASPGQREYPLSDAAADD
jgi:competence ComEA-like helix-hairpin-helix protein